VGEVKPVSHVTGVEPIHAATSVSRPMAATTAPPAGAVMRTSTLSANASRTPGAVAKTAVEAVAVAVT
jgi:hypothetical protein